METKPILDHVLALLLEHQLMPQCCLLLIILRPIHQKTPWQIPPLCITLIKSERHLQRLVMTMEPTFYVPYSFAHQIDAACRAV